MRVFGHGSLVDEVPRRVETIKYAAAHAACGDLHTFLSDGRAFSCGSRRAAPRPALAPTASRIDTPKELDEPPAAGATPQGRPTARSPGSAGAAHGVLVANGASPPLASAATASGATARRPTRCALGR